MKFALNRLQAPVDLFSDRLFRLQSQISLQFQSLVSEQSDVSAQLKINSVSALDASFGSLGALQAQSESLLREAVAAERRAPGQKTDECECFEGHGKFIGRPQPALAVINVDLK